MNRKVVVLMGGPDAEREVSLASGRAVAGALLESGEWIVEEKVINRLSVNELREMEGDLFFPVLHGPWGEGGLLQGLLEEEGRPFVGSDSRASALAMDKLSTKQLVVNKGVPLPAAQLLRHGDACEIDLPLVLKPNDDGSSVDIRICMTDNELRSARTELHPRREVLLAEEFICGREITVGILCDKPLPLLEIVPRAVFYDYEAKYVRADTDYIFRPELGAGVSELCAELAVQVYEEVGCRDLARVDFMVDERGPWFLEINTMPGFTTHSLLPRAAEGAGIGMPELCSKLAEAALRRAVSASSFSGT